MDVEAIRRWPGKTGPSEGDATYPAAYHMLDVAAVSEVLCQGEAWANWAPLMIALHDLGKFSNTFKRMILRESAAPQPFRHWQITEALLQEEGLEDLLCERLHIRRSALRPLIASIAGHHGSPPNAIEDDLHKMRALAGSEAQADAGAFVAACLDLWPAASLRGVKEANAKLLSWRLSGLCTTADWIGSNPAWFPPADRGLSLEAHLAEARARAPSAVAAAGLLQPPSSPASLFDFALRPAQEAATTIPLPDGPTLAILEDETGAGKTEAALLLAQRMLLSGKARGLYFALPTMATADAMFSRVHDIIGNLFEGAPSLTLAHGRSGLSAPFRDIQGAAPRSDSPVCSPWLADSRRRALLANVGVGTIDQALLAALPTKFATLRAWGLSGKILIVDEVHELGDPYMAEELETLLRLHASGGGSAILLSATLPLRLRDRLAAAFAQGAGTTASPDTDLAYPSLRIAGAHRAEMPAAPPSTKGPVLVERLADTTAVLTVLSRAAARGAACVWVRNSVDEAIAAVEALRDQGLTADLLHARFTLGDRKRHEAAALGHFGKYGAGRAGRILVGTQVLESSLDLDFDVMVSDLAPMAALIQRAGRLWRHMDLRPRASRPVPAPVLHVLSPDPGHVASAAWLQSTLGRGAHVYQVADQWRTAQTLFEAGRIEAPHGLRRLIEAVHGEEAAPVPSPLLSREKRDIGEGLAAAGRARQNVIDVAAGYRDGGGGLDDAEYPTRLGRPTRTLLLVTMEDGRLTPLAASDASGEAEALSEVSVASHRLEELQLQDQEAPEVVAFTEGWPDWKRSAVSVCTVDVEGRICSGLGYDAELGLVFS